MTRDGSPIFSTVNPAETHYIDTGKIEGRTYRYNCEAHAGTQVKRGSEDIEVTTLSTNPPDFSGITSVEVITPDSVKLKWGVVGANGVSATYFKIFAIPGFVVDFNAPAFRELTTGSLETVIDGLGDEMPYAFGIRACSEQHVCDENTKVVTATLSDGGPPKTKGIESIAAVNGKVVITVPWNHSMGAVRKRLVFQNSIGGTNLSAYNQTKTEVVSDLTKTPSSIPISSTTDNQTYYFIVIDEDPSGRRTSVSEPYVFSTGDMTAPGFPGIAALKMGAPTKKDSSLTVEFSSIGYETVAGGTGADKYLVYYTTSATTNPCERTTADIEITALGYGVGQQISRVIENLRPRTTYYICIKAKDRAGNISDTSAFLSRSTQDLTPPLFDGITDKQHNPQSGRFKVVWQPSASTDISLYQIRVWKNTLARPDPVHTFVKTASSFPTGFSFSTAEFHYVGGDRLYLDVSACDNAQLILDGVQNCTSAFTTTPYLVPDITPPQNFAGIALSPMMHDTSIEGTINVTWNHPVDYNDYLGFKVYSVNLNGDPSNPESTLTFLKTCQCLANHCPIPVTSCLLDKLDVGRSYTLYVRAYDSQNNHTSYLNPLFSNTTVKTKDLTAPSFVSGLSSKIEEQAGLLTWNAAIDNQYTNEPGAKLTYYIYRKKDSEFVNLSTPETNLNAENLVLIDNLTNFLDQNVGSNVTYFYTVCVQDTAGNRTCSAQSSTISTPDISPPVLALASPATTKHDDQTLKSWSLSWTVTDNAPLSSMSLRLYTYFAGNGANAETPPDTNTFLMQIPQAISTTETSLHNLKGPNNVDTWIHYYLEATDAAGNSASVITSVFSDNEVAITNVTPTKILNEGGQLLFIEGKGFAGSSVTIGDLECTDVIIHTRASLSCYTPAIANGSHILRVRNPNDAGGADFNSIAVIDRSASTSECDHPESGTGHAGSVRFQAGAGTAANPWIICTKAQLDATRYQTTSTKRHYKLGQNIDLGPEIHPTSFPPLSNGSSASQGLINVDFDGSDFALINYTNISPSTSSLGLFRGALTFNLTNLITAGFKVEGLNYVGSVFAYGHIGCNRNFENIKVYGGSVKGRSYVGGFAGMLNTTSNNIMVDSTVVEADDQYVGGVAGQINGCPHQNIKSSAIVTNTSSDSAMIGGIAGWLRTATIVDCEFTGSVTATVSYTGGIAGYINSSDDASIDRCVNRGNISGLNRVGGIVGEIAGGSYIGNVTNYGVIRGAQWVGGVIGSSQTSSRSTTMENLFNHGLVEGSSSTGGIIGNINTSSNYLHTVTNAVNYGNIRGYQHTGGILGTFQGCTSISNSICPVHSYAFKFLHNKGRVTGNRASSINIGGIIGYTQSFIEKGSFEALLNEGTIGDSEFSRVGGIVGYMAGGSFRDAINTGQVFGQQQVGGFSGYAQVYNGNGISKYEYAVERVLNVGRVTGVDPSTTRGLRGSIVIGVNTSSSFANSLWDVTASGINRDSIAGGVTYGYTTPELKQSSTYLSNSWPAPGAGNWEYPVNQYPRLVGWPK